MAKHFIFIGAPGSGKGTQAEKLIKENGFEHISTGNLLRAEVAKKSELGLRVDEVLKSGQLVSDDLVKDLLVANVNFSSPVIFDGYPRTLVQAKVLSEILGERDFVVLFFDVDVNDLVARLTSRVTCKDCGAIFNLMTKAPSQEGICDNCHGENLFQRADDKEEIIRERQKVYKETITPVLDYYRAQGKLISLNANRPIKDIYNEILRLI